MMVWKCQTDKFYDLKCNMCNVKETYVGKTISEIVKF